MAETRQHQTSFVAPRAEVEVAAEILAPPSARALLVMAHGAGAGMQHPFMCAVAERLATHGVATFRYQFPYMQAGRRRPDGAPVLIDTVRAAIDAASSMNEAALPLFAGGKSLGGRMTAYAQAERALPSVRGLIFFGFPLHPAGRPGTDRAAPLAHVEIPMAFLQGTRDALADLDLLRPILARHPGKPQLHVIEGADHGFHVLKRSGRHEDDVLEELATVAAKWAKATSC